MYVWSTLSILTDQTAFNEFVNETWRSGATQVFLYITSQFFSQFRSQTGSLIAELSRAGIEAYAMNGWRGYFSDAEGPKGLYECVESMLSYNGAANANQRFVGFMTDMEPQDGQGVGKPLFHNGIKESALTPSQRADRDGLMQNWLAIHCQLRGMLHRSRLRLAASLPSWTDDYYGEPVLATFDGVTKGVTEFLMKIVDDYCIMSYSTNPPAIEGKIVTKLEYADTLKHPPRIFGGVETHAGVGVNVSYADTPGKASKAALVTDLDAVYKAFNSFRSFSGMNIHDYAGWSTLPVVYADASAPHVPKHSERTSVCGWSE